MARRIRMLAAAGSVLVVGCSGGGGDDIRADLIKQVTADENINDAQKKCITDLAEKTSDADIKALNKEFGGSDPTAGNLSPLGLQFQGDVVKCLIG
jgi:hypothetical protein